MAQQEGMNLLKFMERFGTEEACREYLYQMRWAEGFICPKCGTVDKPYQIKARNKLQCRHCSHQTSVTAGTVMEKTRTPLTKWFLAIYLMGQDKRGCSALRLKRELKVAYDTAWTMSHKIRKAMGGRDRLYLLRGTVEVDDSFFCGTHAGGKRGRGTDKTPVVFGVSLDEKWRPGYLRAKVCDTVDGDALVEFAKSCIVPGSLLRSDGLSAYNKLAKEGYRLESKIFNPKENPDHLKWLHTLVSNAKAFINGTYHGLDDTHLQAFLDEFCYRFNRRNWLDQLFARLLNACVSSKPFYRHALIG